jgi:Histidine kinase-, DNA gyrase B-, and HSP90-like ATPase
VDVASQPSPLVAYKLVIYTFGSLLHLFLMVLILGQRRLGRLESLLFWLMAGLFMWNSGNLLALNVGLFYGVGPRVLEAVARLIPLLGLALSVEDQGRGIPAELKDQIFQPFFTTRPAGTGLGLAIVSRRAEEIDGSVECLSPIGPQGGTRFVVRFRAAA